MNKKKHKGLFVSILLATITLVAFSSTFFVFKRDKKQAEGEKLRVVTSFYPMYIAALNICDGIEQVELQNLSEPETGCLHDYQLSPEDMKLLSTADVFIVNGGGIEEFLVDVAEAYPELTILDASEGLELLEDNAHAWMSIDTYMAQVENITKGLSSAYPKESHEFSHNEEHYMEELEELQHEKDHLAEKVKGTNVVLFHEAYEYVAKDLGLTVSYVMDLDEERQVSAGEVAEVMETINTQKVPVVLAEEEYGSDMGRLVEKETDAKVVYLETLVRGSYDKDSYIKHMRANLEAIEERL